MHFNYAHLAKHQCHITVLLNNKYATIFCSDFSLHWIVDTYTVQSICTIASRVSFECSNSLSINLRGSVGNTNASKVYITLIVQKPPHCPETPLHCPETPTEISLSENPRHCPETPPLSKNPQKQMNRPLGFLTVFGFIWCYFASPLEFFY